MVTLAGVSIGAAVSARLFVLVRYVGSASRHIKMRLARPGCKLRRPLSRDEHADAHQEEDKGAAEPQMASTTQQAADAHTRNAAVTCLQLGLCNSGHHFAPEGAHARVDHQVDPSAPRGAVRSEREVKSGVGGRWDLKGLAAVIDLEALPLALLAMHALQG